MDHPFPNACQLRDALDGNEIPPETQESSAPAAFYLASSASPFIKLKTFELQVRCDHPTFGIISADCADLTRACVTNMVIKSTGDGLCGWCRFYAGACIIEVGGHTVFNMVDFEAACARIHSLLDDNPKQTLSRTLAPGRKEPLRDPGCTLQLHVDQFRPVIRTLF
jgi:hypothetical protein